MTLGQSFILLHQIQDNAIDSMRSTLVTQPIRRNRCICYNRYNILFRAFQITPQMGLLTTQQSREEQITVTFVGILHIGINAQIDARPIGGYRLIVGVMKRCLNLKDTIIQQAIGDAKLYAILGSCITMFIFRCLFQKENTKV